MLTNILKEFDETFECWDRCNVQTGLGECDCPKSEFLPFLKSALERCLDEVKLRKTESLVYGNAWNYGYAEALKDLSAKISELKM